MKKFLLLTFAFMTMVASAFADDVVVSWKSNADWTEEASGFSLAQGSFKVALSQGEGTSKPSVNATSNDARVYAKGTVTISSTGDNLTKVVFNVSKKGTYRLADFTASAGEVVVDAANKQVTWTGNAKEVVVTVGEKAVNGTDGAAKAGQLCFDNLVLTTGQGGTTPDPEPQPEPQPETPELGTAFAENFAAGMGEFTTDNVKIDPALTQVWTHDERYKCVKASGFIKGNSYDTESWLISPVIDLTNATNSVLNYEEAANFFGDVDTFKGACSVKVKVENGEWADLAVTSTAEGTSWSFVPATADLKAYDGKKIQLAFRYTSLATKSGTWELKNILVQGEFAVAPIVVAVPEFTPAAGTYRDQVEVSLKAEEGNKIYYTIDGTYPTSASTLYTAPFTLTESTNVNAIAVDAKGNESQVAVAYYNITVSPKAPENGALYDFSANKWNLQVSDSENRYEILGPIVENGVSLSFTSGSTETRMWNDFNKGLQMRIYTGGSMIFSVPEGMKMVKMTFDAPKFFVTADNGTLEDKVWTGEATKVVFSASKTNNISYVIVECTGKATGIEGVEANETVKVVYDLSGRRLAAPVKGVNIINGKKVLVK